MSPSTLEQCQKACYRIPYRSKALIHGAQKEASPRGGEPEVIGSILEQINCLQLEYGARSISKSEKKSRSGSFSQSSMWWEDRGSGCVPKKRFSLRNVFLPSVSWVFTYSRADALEVPLVHCFAVSVFHNTYGNRDYVRRLCQETL